MNNDIKPSRPARPAPAATSADASQVDSSQVEQPADAWPDDIVGSLELSSASSELKPARSNRAWRWLFISLVTAGLLMAGGFIWYQQALRPVDQTDGNEVSLTIEMGMTPDQIAQALKDENLIRSQLAFNLYSRLHGVRDKLQAGDYRLSSKLGLPDIVEQLSRGQVTEFELTFYPGATLYDRTDIADEKRTDVYTVLRRAGYGDDEIKNAFAKKYDHPLLKGKPPQAALEGYVYGDTYRFNKGTSVEKILERTFDEFYSQITERKLIAKFKQQHMTLHQGIILASIIEREVGDQVKDQKQVSQIFHLRLAKSMPLGADATFMYAAKQLNKAPSSKLDSPYNTRIHAGLPPGPISSPSINALQAAAEPARGDYLFFVSGDDGKTHFAHTMAEHERNTRTYCTDLCYAIE